MGTMRFLLQGVCLTLGTLAMCWLVLAVVLNVVALVFDLPIIRPIPWVIMK